MHKVLYIHQYFKTPLEYGGTRSYWFARELVDSGYSVTMITARAKQKKLIQKEIIDGIEVIYVRNAYSSEMNIMQRLFSFIRFMFISVWIALRQKNVSLVYATSTPLSVGFTALACKLVKNYPYIFEVRDLWPEIPIQMGILKNRFLIKAVTWFEKTIYRKSIHLVALSSGMKAGIVKTGESESKITVIPNMSKTKEFYRRPRNLEMAARFNISVDKFNVIYFGALGEANGLDYIVKVAELLKEDRIDDICFILVGGGGKREWLRKLVMEKELQNILFIDRQPMTAVSELVNICDMSFVPLQNYPVLETSSPNKFFDSLSAGVPVVINFKGWIKDLVEENSCGAYVNPENPVEMYKLVKKLKDDKQLAESLGNSARHLAETVFDRTILCRDFASLINKIVN